MIETPFEDLNASLIEYEEIAIVKIAKLPKNTIELKYINVHPKHRRQNIGNTVLKRICDWCDMNNYQIKILALQIVEPKQKPENFDLPKWYIKHGFEYIKSDDPLHDDSYGTCMTRLPTAS